MYHMSIHLTRSLRTVTVHLTEYGAADVYQEFLRFVACLPNLETLQVPSFPPDCVKHFKSTSLARKSFSMPSIQTYVCQPRMGQLCRYMPNLRRLYILNCTDWSFEPIRHSVAIPLLEILEIEPLSRIAMDRGLLARESLFGKLPHETHTQCLRSDL
jgi:hypothetical protein